MVPSHPSKEVNCLLVSYIYFTMFENNHEALGLGL